MTKTDPEISMLLGKRIHRIVGWDKNRLPKEGICADHILFDDHETYVTLTEQDQYDYHDCSPSARNIYVNKDKKGWASINDDDRFKDATVLTE